MEASNGGSRDDGSGRIARYERLYRELWFQQLGVA
jgi:hypothetical protein